MRPMIFSDSLPPPTYNAIVLLGMKTYRWKLSAPGMAPVQTINNDTISCF